MRAYQKPGRQACGVEDCSGPLYCRGVCVMHYNRLRKKGDVGQPARIRNAAGSGSINPYGYRVLRLPEHPLARQQGKVLEHRVVLYARIGEGAHPCHWCGKSLTWVGRPSERIAADHLDGDRLNNRPDNLVPACLHCNTTRAAAC